MTWKWRFLAADGREVSAAGYDAQQMFPSQSDAESWLGEEWRGLAAAGVAAVTLLDAEREVYGPMSLSPG
ncbi:MAG: hypothetical protein K0U64_00890 [Actinomycetia bacterium]|nr:hypothetical protein [Actinomycetes bacterium]